jgi:hypothetical protein
MKENITHKIMSSLKQHYLIFNVAVINVPNKVMLHKLFASEIAKLFIT